MFGLKQPMRGLFARPVGYQTPGINPAMPHAYAQPPAEVARPGIGTRLLGKGWEDKAFALGGILQGDGGRAYSAMREAAAQQQYAAEQARAAALAKAEERAYDRADWQWKEDYKRENPTPANNDTIADFNWYKGLPDEDRALYHRMNPQYMTVDNGNGTKTIVPVGPNGPVAGPTTPSRPVGRLVPMGGGAGNGVGGF